MPLATNSAVATPNGVMGFLGGSCVPFPPEKVRALYGDADTYLARFEQATLAVEKSGAILPRSVEPLIAEAKETFQKAIAGRRALPARSFRRGMTLRLGHVTVPRSEIRVRTRPGSGHIRKTPQGGRRWFGRHTRSVH